MNPGQLSKNILSSWGGYAVRFTIGLLFIPFITSTLGEDRYGVWVICFQAISYFSLLEFGLDRALLRYIPKFLGRNQFESVNRVLNTATAFYMVVGSLTIGLTWHLAEPIFELFETAIPALSAEGVEAFRVIGIYLGIRFCLAPFGGNLGSFQRFDLANLLQAIEDVVRTALMVWALSMGEGLPTLAGIIAGTTVLRLVIAAFILKRLHPEVKLSLRLVRTETARTLFGYGWVSLAITMTTLLIYSSEAPLLGILISTGAAGVYAPAAQLMLYMRHMVNTMGTPLTAALSQIDSQGDTERVRTTYFTALRFASVLSFLAGSGIIVLAPEFVALWLDESFGPTGPIMQVLALGAVFFVPQIIGNALLFGLERHRSLLLVLALEAALKIGLAILLVEKYGLIGMAWAGSLPQILLYTTLYPLLISRVLKRGWWQVMWTGIKPGAMVAVVVVPSGLILKQVIPPDTWLAFGGLVLLLIVLAVGPAVVALTYEERSKVRQWLKKFVRERRT